MWEKFYSSVRAHFYIFLVKIWYILPSHVGCHDLFLSHFISIKLIPGGIFSKIPVTTSSLLRSDFHLFPALSCSRYSSSLCLLLWEWALQWVAPYVTIAISYYGNHNRNFINCSFPTSTGYVWITTWIVHIVKTRLVLCQPWQRLSATHFRTWKRSSSPRFPILMCFWGFWKRAVAVVMINDSIWR